MFPHIICQIQTSVVPHLSLATKTRGTRAQTRYTHILHPTHISHNFLLASFATYHCAASLLRRAERLSPLPPLLLTAIVILPPITHTLSLSLSLCPLPPKRPTLGLNSASAGLAALSLLLDFEQLGFRGDGGSLLTGGAREGLG